MSIETSQELFKKILFGSLFVETDEKLFLKVAPFPTFHTKKVSFTQPVALKFLNSFYVQI